MSPPPSTRLLARGLVLLRHPPAAAKQSATQIPHTHARVRAQVEQQPRPQASRAFSTTVSRPAESAKPQIFENYVARLVKESLGSKAIPSTTSGVLASGGGAGTATEAGGTEAPKRVDHSKPFKFSVYAAKQNTHITVAKPNGDAIISLSCGNIGFRKASRKKYDSAYQLAAFVFDQLYRDGWHEKMTAIELTLRGFGQGRDAVSKALCGYEGRYLKDKFVSVADSTRLKFGGTRSRNPRRLG